jgi:uncharacterized membrane protein YjfL (UPF0719 family)
MPSLFAQVQTAGLLPWPPNTLWEAALASSIFGVIGIALAILGFKVFDWLTPGSLVDEILKKGNIAAAILGGAFVVGICLVIAAAIG